MANSQKSVLVAGGVGFIGSHLCESFLNQGYCVIAVDNLCTALPENLELLQELGKERFHFVNADVSKPWSEWEKQVPGKFLSDVEFVFHFASPASPPLYQDLALETMWTNTIGLSNAINWADHHKARCIFASTSEVYGDPEVHPQPESYKGCVNTTGPRSCYDESKRFGETLVYTHNWKKGTAHGIVRIFNTYGPRMNPTDGRVVINLITQARKGLPLTIFGDGLQTRSFCYVDDLISGIQAYARSSECMPINLGTNQEFTILELSKKIQQLFPEKALSLKHLDFPQDDPLQRQPVLTLAKEKLQWEAKTTLQDGLVKLNKWLETFE